MDGRLAGFVVAASLSALSAGSALAEGWTVERVSGTAWAISPAAQSVVLSPGMSVEDGTTVATAAGGRLRMARAGDVLTLSPGSSLVVMPGAGRETTRVLQRAGEVEVAVAPRPRRSFSVETPFLAAVVKGTRFTVSADARQAAVRVSEGLVGVKDLASGQSADVGAGQSARAGVERTGLSVAGPGAPSVSAGRPEAPSVSTLESQATLDAGTAADPAPAGGSPAEGRGAAGSERGGSPRSGERAASLVGRERGPVPGIGMAGPDRAGPGLVSVDRPDRQPVGENPAGPAVDGLPNGPVTGGVAAGPQPGGIGVGGGAAVGGVAAGGSASVGPGGVNVGVSVGGISVGVRLGGRGGLDVGLGGPTRNEK